MWLLLGIVGSVPALGADQTHENTNPPYVIRYDKSWELVPGAEPGVDVFACGPPHCKSRSTITIGAVYMSQLRDADPKLSMQLASSKLITAQLKAIPMVDSFRVLREGKTRLGQSDAYEVVLEIKLTNGVVRKRHSYSAFSKGYFYNVSFHSDPGTYEADFRRAKVVLDSFQPK